MNKINNIEIIAEIGWNHMGDISLATEMIKSARENGANTVKFQYWDPAHLKSGVWDTDGRREIYDKAALTIEKISELQKISTEIGCNFLISVFGTIGANVISDLGIKNIKIPSFSIICSITKEDLLTDFTFDFTIISSSSFIGFLYSILQDFTIINTLCSSNSFRFERFNDDIISVLALSKNFK